MTLEHLDTVIAFAVIMLGSSLLITILTQSVSTLLGLRGTNLLRGLTTVLKTVDSRLAGDAGQIAHAVLTHPIISDSTFSHVSQVPVVGWLVKRWKLASAVRVEEVVAVLKMLSQPDGGEGAQQPGAAATQAPSALSANQRTSIRTMLDRIDPQAATDIQQLATGLGKLAPGATEQANQTVRQIAATAERSLGSLEPCFNAAMDRVSQKFVTQMRIWTIIFSVAFAFFAHMDAFRLFSQLSSSSELQGRLIASADALTKQAGEITAAEGNAVPAVYQEAMRSLIRQTPAVSYLADPPAFPSPTKRQYEDWLRQGVKPPVDPGELITKYEVLVQAGLKTDADRLADQANAMKSIYQQTQLQLFPQPYIWNWSHDSIWGLLAAAALLSLGAPFWFNALKTLTNLRPLLATKTEQA